MKAAPGPEITAPLIGAEPVVVIMGAALPMVVFIPCAWPPSTPAFPVGPDVPLAAGLGVATTVTVTGIALTVTVTGLALTITDLVTIVVCAGAVTVVIKCWVLVCPASVPFAGEEGVLSGDFVTVCVGVGVSRRPSSLSSSSSSVS